MALSVKKAERMAVYLFPGGTADQKNRLRYLKSEGILPSLPAGRTEGPDITYEQRAKLFLAFAAPLATEGVEFVERYQSLELVPEDHGSILGDSPTLLDALIYALTWEPFHENCTLHRAEITQSWPYVEFVFRKTVIRDGLPTLFIVRYGYPDSFSARDAGYHTSPARKSLIIPETVFGSYAQNMVTPPIKPARSAFQGARERREQRERERS